MRRLLQRPLGRVLPTTAARARDDGLALASERQHFLITNPRQSFSPPLPSLVLISPVVESIVHICSGVLIPSHAFACSAPGAIAAGAGGGGGPGGSSGQGSLWIRLR